MRRPPHCVIVVARTHWLVAGVILIATGALHVFTHKLPQIEFEAKTYMIAGGLAALYLLAGILVWFGAPFGPLLSRICALLYLPRPQFGSHIWDIMNSPEFRAHFHRGPDLVDRSGAK
jgi:hypothetical protein